MKTKILAIGLIALAVLWIASSAVADIGPSPAYNFSISASQPEHTNYKFYYAGNLWPEKLTLISPSITSVYKLNTKIKVYAVPAELASDIDLYDFQEIASKSVVSQEISLKPGTTEFEIASFDSSTGKMELIEKSHAASDINLMDPITIVTLGFFVLVAIAVIIIGYCVLGKKKPPKK